MQWVYCLKTKMLLVCFNLLIVNPQIKIQSVFSVSVIWVWFEKIGVNHPPYCSGDKTAETWKEIVEEKFNSIQKPSLLLLAVTLVCRHVCLLCPGIPSCVNCQIVQAVVLQHGLQGKILEWIHPFCISQLRNTLHLCLF